MVKQVTQEIKSTLNENLNLATIAKGIMVSYIVTIPLFVVFSLVLTYTTFPEKYIPASVIITTIISLLIAGSTAARNVRSRGWLNGAIVGAIYMLVLYILGSLTFGDFSINRYVVTMLAIGLITGAIGGIVGINLKYGSRGKRRR